MFGYINIYKDELKVKDYNMYRAYYCGLCKKIGKNHNQFVRLSLSYDLTFLAMVLDSMSKEESIISYSGCIKKFGKRKIVTYAEGLDYSSDMNVILSYYKLRDDIRDSFSFKALFGIFPFLRRAYKIKKKYPKLCKVISDSMMRIHFLEETKCDIIDQIANEFAVILKEIFKTCDETLSSFGYELGRLIYIMDAYDDMHHDYKKQNYNPANLQYRFSGEITNEIYTSMKSNLYISLSQLAEKYEQIKIIKNKEILDNIIYLGLRAKCDEILCKCTNRKELKYEKSL